MADQKSTLHHKRRHEVDSNPETKRQRPTTVKQILPATNLTDLNDDCLQYIFEHLKLQDLLNVANSNKFLIPAACLVFGKKHGPKQIYFGNRGYDWPIFTALPDKLCIRNLKTGFQFLRCFGRCITKLKVNYEEISNRNCSRINQYIQKYCASSLTEIDFYNAPEFLENTEQSFSNVKSVCVFGGDLASHLPKFAKWFPQMRRLELYWNENYADAFFPHLEHLGIFIDGSDYARKKEDVAALIRSNHLHSLKISFPSHSVSFNEFLKIIGTQPLITKLTVMHGIKRSTMGKRIMGRFVSAVPSLIELDLDNFKLSSDAAIICTRQFKFLKKFRFSLADYYSRREYLRQQLGDEWQISGDFFTSQWSVEITRCCDSYH